jgi:hypothetical protein
VNAPSQDAPGWSVVFEAPDEWRAEMARSWLLDEGIPAIVESHCVPGYGIALNPVGTHWGDVKVPNKCLQAARLVLEETIGEPVDQIPHLLD